MSHDLDPRRMDDAAWLRTSRGRVESELEQKTPPPATGMPVLLPHRHIRRHCSDSGAQLPDTAPTKLVPQAVKPGFILPNGAVNEDVALSRLIFDLLNSAAEYRALLAPQSLATRRPHSNDQVRIALVDLVGRNLCSPKIAGFGLTTRTPGASLTKILIYLAAHQLLFDLQDRVRQRNIRALDALRTEMTKEWARLKCKPNIDWLFKFTAPSTPSALLKVEMNADRDPSGIDCPPPAPPGNGPLRPAHLLGYQVDIAAQCDSTKKAGELIMHLGFEYIASVAWQYGLWHPRRGGLWYGTTYCDRELVAATSITCHTVTSADCTRTSRVLWRGDPVGRGAVEATALSVATFFTLLAQRKLVTPDASASIEKFLLRTRCAPLATPPLNLPRRASKCGDAGNLYHDGALIEPDEGERLRAKEDSRRYAIAILTVGRPAQLSADTMRRLGSDLDFLVRNRRLRTRTEYCALPARLRPDTRTTGACP